MVLKAQSTTEDYIRAKVITARNRFDALLLVFVVRYLLCCGDVEMNPGPTEENLAQHPQLGDLQQDDTPDGSNQVQSDCGTPRKCTADTSISPDMATQILEAIESFSHWK